MTSVRVAPVPAAPARPRLRLVPPTYVPSRLRQRRRQRLVMAGVAVLAVMFLGAVVAHNLLIQGQVRLQQIEVEVANQQARYQRLRLEVGRLESPERIVAAAQQQLGMVPPPGVTYLSPDGPLSGITEPHDDVGGAEAGGAPTPAWAAMKPHLGPLGR